MIIVLLSFFLLIFAPERFDFNFCLACFGGYLCLFYFCYKHDVKNKEYLSFNLLFFIGIFLTTFVVPFFFSKYATALFGSMSIYINKTVALTLMSLSFYYCGWKRGIKGEDDGRSTNVIVSLTRKGRSFLYVLCALLLLVYSYYLLEFITILSGTTNDLSANFLISLIQPIYTVSLYLNTVNNKKICNLRTFVYYNLFILFCFAFIIITEMFIVGDRTMPIFLLLIIVSVYTYNVRPMKFSVLLMGVFVATLFMFVIGRTRTTDSNYSNTSVIDLTANTVSSTTDPEEVFQDFLVVHYASYLLLNWDDFNEKLFYPEKIFILLVSPIPYVPSMLASSFCGVEWAEMNSTTLTATEYNRNVQNLTGGIGTQIVCDVFVSWGYVGVIVIFSLFGFIVGKSQKKKRHFLYALVLYPLIGDALYMARGTIFTDYRIIMLELFLIYVLITFFKCKKKEV